MSGTEKETETGLDAADAELAAGLGDGYDGLMFRWRDRAGRPTGFALAFFLGIALLVHAVGFYLFQVNAPISARVEARSAKVTMLDHNDAATAALLREVDDRLVFLRPASMGTGSRLRIEDFSVTFEPSFLRGQVEFRPPAGKSEKERLLAELLPQHGLVLPPVARHAPGVAPKSTDDAAPDLSVVYLMNGTLRIPDWEGEPTLEQAVAFFERQELKDHIAVVLTKNTLSAEEREALGETLQEYFAARGYQAVTIRQARGGIDGVDGVITIRGGEVITGAEEER